MANILEANSIFYILITFGIDAALIAAVFGLCELIHHYILKNLQSNPTAIRSSLNTRLLHNQEIKESEAENGRNIFAQFKKVFKLKNDDIRRKCTNDEQIYLLFVKYNYMLFSILFILGCIVLLPIYLTEPSTFHYYEIDAYTLNAMSSTHKRYKLWIMYAVAYIYLFVIGMLMFKLKQNIIAISLQKNVNKRDNYQDYCLLIKNLPRVFNSLFDNVLAQILLEQNSSITRVHVVDDMFTVENELNSYLTYRELLQKIKRNEEGMSSDMVMKFGVMCCKKSHNVEKYCIQEMEKLDHKVDESMLKMVKEVAPYKVKESTMKFIRGTGYAIIFFQHSYDASDLYKENKAHKLVNSITLDNIGNSISKSSNVGIALDMVSLYKKRRYTMAEVKISQCYNPYDIIWHNLGAHNNVFKAVLFDILLFILCIIVIPAIAGASALNSLLNSIANKFDISFITNFIENYCSSLIMTFFNSVVIPYMINLITNEEGFKTRMKQESAVMKKNIFFQIMCCVILPILSLTTIKAVINKLIDPSQFVNILKNLAQSLITQSLYFINYTIQAIFFSNFLSFLVLFYLLPDLMKFLMQKIISKLYSPTDTIDYKVGYNSALVITNFAYCLFFSISSPIINIFAVIMFYTKYYIDLYNLTHSYAFRTKSPMQYGNSLIVSTITSSILYILGMAAYFSLHIHIAAGLCFLAFGIAFYSGTYAMLICAKCNWIQNKLGLLINNMSDSESEVRISIIDMDDEYKKNLYYLYQNSYNKFKEMRANDLMQVLR